MHKNLSIWQFIYSNLEQDIPVIMLYVLQSKGSSPGRQGFMMAVNALCEMNGSIGGGIMEHKFIEMAKAKMQQEPLQSLYLQVHDKEAAANQSGMICSGEQTIFMYRVKSKDAETIVPLIISLQSNENATLTLTNSGIHFSNTIPAENFFFNKKSETEFEYVEKTGFQNRLFIVGGGHCSIALSRLMSTMDFFIEVFDERAALNTMQQNQYAHRQHIVNDYTLLKEMITGGKHHFVVIMTVGYRTDAIVLKALQHQSFAYLGMLGSKAKTGKLLDELMKEGVDKKFIASIHAPIGIPIKSQTTEEIAISIAAEIISVKNEKW